MRSLLLPVAFTASALLPSWASAQAQTIHGNDFYPTAMSVPFGVVLPSGEVGADVEGILHFQYSTTIRPDGTGRVKWHYNPQGMVGTGWLTGVSYHAVGLTQQTTDFKPGGGVSISYTNIFKFVGEGPGNNWAIRATYHLVIASDGTVRVENDRYDVLIN